MYEGLGHGSRLVRRWLIFSFHYDRGALTAKVYFCLNPVLPEPTGPDGRQTIGAWPPEAPKTKGGFITVRLEQHTPHVVSCAPLTSACRVR